MHGHERIAHPKVEGSAPFIGTHCTPETPSRWRPLDVPLSFAANSILAVAEDRSHRRSSSE
jgi:hypothetical protein